MTSNEAARRSVAISPSKRDRRHNDLTLFTCPDCGGTLWQVDEAPLLRFQCHVGHAFGPEALIDLKSEEVEAALWACVRLLTEKATLSRQLATRSLTGPNGARGARIEEQAQQDERHANVIRELLGAAPTPIEQTSVFDQRPGELSANP